MSTHKCNIAENRNLQLLFILIVCFFAFFLNNNVIPADLMESRNLATAQEMVREGNYLLPTMNGELRIAKPPLPTWVAAAVEHVIPGSLTAQRCAAGVMATMMIYFVYFLSVRLTKKRLFGFISALVLATCFNVVFMGRNATWDIYCHSFMLGAIYFMFISFERETKYWLYFILSGLFMGLSFLSKGPVSFYALLLPFIISYIIVYRPRLKGKISPLVVMIVITLIVSFIWVSYVYIFHKDMLLAVSHKESSSWIDHNVRPFYYYWQFPAEAGIWALFLISALIYFFVKKNIDIKKEYRFSVIFFLASLILLSLIPEKKTRYLLPILIPGAMVIASYLYNSIKGFDKKWEKIVFKINATIIAVVLLSIPIAMYILFFKESLLSLPIFVLITIISWSLCIYTLLSIFSKKQIKVENVIGTIIVSMIMIEALCLIPVGHMFINPERHSIRMLRNEQNVQTLPFYYNQNEQLRMELVYEVNKKIMPLDITNDSVITKNKPFVFISKIPIDEVFKGKNVTIEILDNYDNNWRKVNSKRYNTELVRQAAVIK